MIIPTAEFDPLFARDGKPFQEKMWDYIRREFADLLGPQAADQTAAEALAVAAPPLQSGSHRKPARSDAA